MEEYYRILKIRRGATQIEIRNAYRKLAKKLHPDVNDSPTANEDFIELNEAYEFLTDPDLRRKLRYKATPRARKTARTTQHKQWNKEKRSKARQKAKQYAKQRREDYLKRKDEELRQYAPRFISMYLTAFFILVIIPIMFTLIPLRDVLGRREPTNWGGLFYLLLFWGGPLSYVLYKQIRKEIELLKKK